MKIYREINQRNCYNLMNTLTVSALVKNQEFILITAYKGKQLVLYVFRKLLYILRCQEVRKIYVFKKVNILHEKTKKRRCNRDIEAFIDDGKTEGEKSMLYLQNNKILKGFTTEINCYEDDLDV